MKTLKFMLAAATAIGLASAAHADQLEASTGFEKWTAGENVVVGTGYSDEGVSGQTSYFWEYSGAQADDNESKIVSSNMSSWASIRPRGTAFFTGADNGASAKILEVSTGTDPLLRRFRDNGAAFDLGGESGAAQLYVDTLVQFTVTPKTDPVTNDSADKLMIYLKESAKIVEGVESETETVTNLVVKGGFYNQSFEMVPHDYTVKDVVIDPTQWYRLTVKAIPNFGNLDRESFPAFYVAINGTPCVFTECPAEEAGGNYPEPFTDTYIGSETFDELDNKTFVFSMVKGNETTGVFGLRAVGFAGEGKVDDLVISTFDPTKTVIDFTFSLAGTVAGLTSDLTYSCSVSGQSGSIASSDPARQIKCFADDAITVGYTLDSGYAAEWTFTGGASILENVISNLTANGTATLTISSSGGNDWEADPTQIDPTKTAAEVYPALATSALATANAQKLTVWATAQNIAFNDATTDQDTYVEAFLLNCAVAEVDDEKDEFVANITFVNGLPVVTPPAGKTYNGTLQLKGSTNLTTWTDVSAASSDYQFYKYELSL